MAIFFRCSTSDHWDSELQKYECGLSQLAPKLDDCLTEGAIQACHDSSLGSKISWLCLKFQVASIYYLPDIINCLFYMLVAARLKAVLFLSPDQQSGDDLRDPAVDSEHFQRDLKTYLFTGYGALTCSTNPHFLTYVLIVWGRWQNHTKSFSRWTQNNYRTVQLLNHNQKVVWIRDVPNFGSGSGRSGIRPFMANPALAILLARFGQVPDNNIRAVPCCKQSIIVFPVYV